MEVLRHELLSTAAASAQLRVWEKGGGGGSNAHSKRFWKALLGQLSSENAEVLHLQLITCVSEKTRC